MANENPKVNPHEDRPDGNEEKTPFERFDDLMTKLLAVPKEEVDEMRAAREREKKEKRAG